MTVISKLQMVDLKGQFEKIKNEVMLEIESVLDSMALINGPKVKEFEQSLSEYLGAKHVIGCGNGTDALQIALMSLDLNPGDEVITTPFTFVATSEVIALLGLKPVFVDIDPNTFLIDVAKIAEAITGKTKVIIPVHLYGQCCDMESIMDIAREYKLFVVEDNAQAIGASVFIDGKWKKSGTIGDIGCTSFFPSKNLGCFGDGGAIITNNEILGKKIRKIVNHGSEIKYYHEIIGVNSRLDSIQAAVLNVKLKYVDGYSKSRLMAAQRYNELLSNIEEIQTPIISKKSEHVFHQYTCILKKGDRDKLVKSLNEKGVPCMIYYPVPLHKQIAYLQNGELPYSERLSEQVFSLPMHTELTLEDQELIVNSIKELL